jgi:endonuclease/exonuclease/phosphatase family metal-dependent hydrolase
MRLLTWNLGGHLKEGKHYKDAEEMAMMHLEQECKSGEPVIAGFQECRDYSQLRQKLMNKYHVYGAGSQVVLSTEPLSDQQSYDRFVAARTTIHGHSFAIISYHGWDRRNHRDQTLRGGAASEFRWLIDDYCRQNDALIMGDFNADLTETEVQNRWCLGFGSKDHVSNSHGRSRSRYKAVRPAGTDSIYLGTHYWTPEGSEPKWSTYDFLVVSEQLEAATSCKVEKKLGGKAAVDANGRPVVSDHLPVVGEIRFP